MLAHKNERLERSLANLDLSPVEPWRRNKTRRPANGLSCRQTMAAVHCAVGVLSFAEIRDRLGVGRTQFWQWRRNPKFARFVSAERDAFYALLWRRVGASP